MSRTVTLGGRIEEKTEVISYLMVGRRGLPIRSSRPARKRNHRVEDVVFVSLPRSIRLHHPYRARQGSGFSRCRWSSHRHSVHDCDQDRIRDFRGHSLSQVVSLHDRRRSFLPRGSVSADPKSIQQIAWVPPLTVMGATLRIDS